MPIRPFCYAVKKNRYVGLRVDCGDLLEESYHSIPDLPRDRRELRSLARTRESLIKVRTKIKNRITHELEAAYIKLSSVLSDVFGKSGRHIVDGLLNGKDLEEVLDSIPSKRVRANKEEIRGIIQANLSPSQISPSAPTWI
jgi:hypothetical protein